MTHGSGRTWTPSSGSCADGPLVWRYLPERDRRRPREARRREPSRLLSFWLIRESHLHGPERQARFDYFHEVITDPGAPTTWVCSPRCTTRMSLAATAGQFPPGLLPHRPHSQRPEPIRLHRRHPHPPLPPHRPRRRLLAALRHPRTKPSFPRKRESTAPEPHSNCDQPQ